MQGKGLHASVTENRRDIWEEVVWQLALDNNRLDFSSKEYHKKLEEYCERNGKKKADFSGVLMSLTNKSLIGKDPDKKNGYKINPKLAGYLTERRILEYGYCVRLVQQSPR